MIHEHAITLLENGNVNEAINVLRKALQLNPDDSAAYVNLCLAQETLGQFGKAMKGYRWIVSRWPENIEAKSNLANLLARSGMPDEAAKWHGSVLASHPEDLYSLDALAKVKCDQGKIEEAVANLKRIAEITGHPRAWSEYLSYSLHLGYDLEGHKEWVEKFAKPLAKPIPRLPYDGKRKIKIGYVSNTWDRHSVSAFILPILRGHSDQVHVTLYSDVGIPPELLTEADDFKSTSSLNHFGFGNRIREDKIDVLVDLDGHKRGGRLLAFASNPAPVLASINGYLANTFLTRNFNLGWAYEPFEDAPDVPDLPADRNGFVTFGSFHRTHKITLGAAKVWADVLAAVPSSRLVVAAKGGEANTSVRERLETAGVPSDRLTLVAPHRSTGEYLKRLGEVDVHLDAFPFSGVSITCDLLWQGVASVTFEWAMPQGHSTAEILRTVGLDDLVAQSEGEYVGKAVSLAADLDQLRTLRADLRQRMAPLVDGKALAERLEQKYREALKEPRPPTGKPCGKCQRKRKVVPQK